MTNPHRVLILYQNPVRKHYLRQNIDESGNGLRETIVLGGRSQLFKLSMIQFFGTCKSFALILASSFACTCKFYFSKDFVCLLT